MPNAGGRLYCANLDARTSSYLVRGRGADGLPFRLPGVEGEVLKLVLWLILLVLCWPLALLALVLYPIVWVLLLPFRLLGVAVEGVFTLLTGILLLPGRLLRGPRHA